MGFLLPVFPKDEEVCPVPTSFPQKMVSAKNDLGNLHSQDLSLGADNTVRASDRC
jgi:hypothetical protein